MSHNSAPLPYGWIQQTDPNTQHTYWVDTKATPPRSIWTHPHEDEQFLREHPDVREKVSRKYEKDDLRPPSYDGNRRHSYNGAGSSSQGHSDSSHRSGPPQKKGLLGKLKDKAIGTKEERELEKRNRQEVSVID